MTDALSAHRHISFTAHYTGYIWYSMGISHPVFATRKGKLLAKLVHPCLLYTSDAADDTR